MHAIVTRTDIADAISKLEAHQRQDVTENNHVSGHADALACPGGKLQSPKASTKLDPSIASTEAGMADWRTQRTQDARQPTFKSLIFNTFN